jgi:hypothetical protein
MCPRLTALALLRRSSAIDATLKTAVLRADMDIGDADIAQDRRARARKLAPANDLPGIVTNPMVRAVTTNGCRIQECEPSGQSVAVVTNARVLMEKDRAGLGIWLGRSKWPIGQDKFWLTLIDEPKAMTARVCWAFGDPDQG